MILVAGKLNQINTLKDENDSLKCQVEAYKNELEMMKTDNQNKSDGTKQEVKSLQMALQGMQQVEFLSLSLSLSLSHKHTRTHTNKHILLW